MTYRPKHLVALAASLLLPASAAMAVDGVIEINHIRALAGGVSGGALDAPGYPVSIRGTGSYRLTGNLLLPDTNTTAIEVLVPDVTIDLNGFAIQNGTSCRPDCAPTGTGIGVDASGMANVSVVNGTVFGMGSHGVVLGDRGRAEDLRVLHNGGTGIATANGGTVRGNTVSSSGGTGISTSLGSVVSENTVANSGASGIGGGTGSSIRGNTVDGSANSGLVGGSAVVVQSNTVQNSGDDGIVVGSNAVVVNNVVTNSIGTLVAGIDADQGSAIIGNVSAGATSNGIEIATSGSALDNTVTNNGQVGVFVNGAGTVARNTIVGNGAGVDAFATGTVVTGNAIYGNTGFGIQGNGWNGFGGNVLRGNNSGSGETSGFIQIDGNICGNDLVCP
jgi:hypothetical protein